MSAPAKTVTLPEVPAEVLFFAAEKGVSEWLYPVLEMTVRAFPGSSIKLSIQYDYEDPEWQFIVLETDVHAYTLEQYRIADDALGMEFVQTIPPFARRFFVNSTR